MKLITAPIDNKELEVMAGGKKEIENKSQMAY